jgi:hypothetical protein
MRRIFYAAATVVAAGALALTGAGAAGASATAHPNATPACSAVFSQCATPVVAVSATSAGDLVPANNFALQYTGANPGTGVAYGTIETSFSNSLQDGTEDWSWVSVATVPVRGKGAFKFTGFDNANFGGDPVYELEYTPFGQDTQLCLTISSKYRPNGAVLGNCISAAQQAFIVTQTAPSLAQLTAATGAYQYAFDVSQAANIQHHLALLAPHANINGELVAAGNAVHVAAGKASLNEWASIP